MKKMNTLIALLTFVLFSFQSNAQQFEGTINIKSSDKEGLNAVFTLKKHMVKMEAKTEEGLMTIITNKRTGDKTTLIDNGEEKTGFKQNRANQPAKIRESLQKKAPKEESKVSIQITEETKTIGDYECYKVTGKDEQVETEAWVAKDLKLSMADLFSVVNMKQKEKDAYQKAFGENGFILEMKTKNLASEEEKSMTAKVEESEIEDSAFDIPEGYEFTDLTDIQTLMKDAAGNAEKLQEIRKAILKSRSGN